MREDGAFIEAGENDNLIVQKLQANPNALGVFGYSFLDQNADSVQGSLIDGEEPTFDSIAEGSYPVSRPLQFYVHAERVGVTEGLAAYVQFFVSDDIAGGDGPLAEYGLVALPDDELAAVQALAEGL